MTDQICIGVGMMRLFGLGRSPQTFEFKCSCCGEIHRGSPSFAWDAPVTASLPEAEYDKRVILSDDLCRILPREDDDETEFWIRVILEIPIAGAPDPFTWGVWVSQSSESFDRYVETFDTDQSACASFGWLPNTLPYYSEVLLSGEVNIGAFACAVNWGDVGARPTLELHEVDHPLYRDQVDGISWDKAIEIAQIAMHGPQDQ